MGVSLDELFLSQCDVKWNESHCSEFCSIILDREIRGSNLALDQQAENKKYPQRVIVHT